MTLSAPDISAPATPSNFADPQPSTTLKPLVFGSVDSLIERWYEVAAGAPDEVFALDAEQRFTFAEADRLSTLLALDLQRRLGDDTRPIAALLGHDALAAVTWIAILKTGRLIVVLDTHLPKERIEQIAGLAGITTTLVDDRFTELAADLPGEHISLDTLVTAANADQTSSEALTQSVEAELTYAASRGGKDGFQIVFTSGSTGVPKGVVQTHESFLHDVATAQKFQKYGPGDRTSMVLPLSFVAGTIQIVTILITGAGLYFIDPRDAGVDEMIAWVRKHRIHGIYCTPHLLRGITAALGEGDVLDSVRIVATLGEGVHSRDLEAISHHVPKTAAFSTGFGSSEMVILTQILLPFSEPIPQGTIPVGTVIAGKTLKIVREDGSLAGPGETGDIIVVSDYLSGGYWNNDELTAEKFGFDEDGNRYIRQGDLGKVDADGVLTIVGRSDSHVKVRGYLVEPSEIESALLSAPEIAEAVVVPVVDEGAPTRLIAYVAPASVDDAPSNAAIRRALRASLPEYMVPTDIVQLSSLPRTERGKVDRKALPEVPPHVTNVEEMEHHELAMSTIWQHVLGLPELNLDDDFMALGGDSLSTEEMLTLVHEHFGVDLPANELLDHPTLREFTKRVMADGSSLPSHPDVITLNATAKGEPLFCFAGAGALALTFFPFSKHFTDSPVYAFQQHGLEQRALPDRSIEETALRYLPLIRVIRPHGPYRLVGHSFGGMVAMEVARLLTEAGEQVERVVILDTYLPRRVSEMVDDVMTNQADEATLAMAQHSGHAAAAGSAVDSATESKGSGSSGGPLARLALARDLALGLKGRYLPDGLPARENVARQARAYLAGYLQHPGQTQYDSFYDRGILLLRKYEVRPYSGHVVLVLAEENPDGAGGWDVVLRGQVDTVQLKAGHRSLLREPFVSELADRVRPLLEVAVADDPSSEVPAR